MKAILFLSVSCLMFSLLSTAQVKVYKGSSRYSSDIEFSFDGKLTIEEFVAVWYAVKYRY